MVGRATLLLVGAAAAAVLCAGCGGGSGATTGTVATTTTKATPAPPEVPGSKNETGAQHRMAAIIQLWATRLNKGDYDGIAKLFSVPAIFIQGPYEYRLVNLKQVALWNSGLPCSGKIVAVIFRGSSATAIFKLGTRPSIKCDAPGTYAAARFKFVKGKIVEWAQVTVPAGKVPKSNAA